MQTTAKLGLKKPDGTDVVNIQDFNDNADLLDNYVATTETLVGTKAPLASPALSGTPTAPTAAVDTSTTQVATTAFVLGQAGAAAPTMNGAAGVGTSKRYARADHVHPVDTSRAAQMDFAAHLADDAKHTVYAMTTNVGNSYSMTVPNLTSLTDGLQIRVKFNAASTGAITVNPNGLGAKNVVDYFGNAVTNVRANLIVNLGYESSSGNFIILGKGGGGTAQPSDVVQGKTFTNDLGLKTGTIVDRSGGGHILADQINSGDFDGDGPNVYLQPPAGKYDGITWIRALVPNLIASNIKSGVSILAETGTLIPLPDSIAAIGMALINSTAPHVDQDFSSCGINTTSKKTISFTDHSNSGGGVTALLTDANANLILNKAYSGMGSPVVAGISDRDQFMYDYSPSAYDFLYVASVATGENAGSVSFGASYYVRISAMNKAGTYIGVIVNDDAGNFYDQIYSWNGTVSSLVVNKSLGTASVIATKVVVTNSGNLVYGNTYSGYKVYLITLGGGYTQPITADTYFTFISADLSNNVYICTQNSIYKMNANGTLAWSVSKTTWSSDTSYIQCAYAIGYYVYVSQGTKVHKLNASTGVRVNTIDFTSVCPPYPSTAAKYIMATDTEKDFSIVGSLTTNYVSHSRVVLS